MNQLTWSSILTLVFKDGAGLYHPTPGNIADVYIKAGIYKHPSRKFPHTHTKPLRNPKFARYLLDNDITLAKELGIKDMK